MSWTDERVALLRKLWGEGKTAAEIANALGDVTRNAVIGKAHRLKLSNRISPIQQNNKKPAPAAKPAAPRASSRKVVIREEDIKVKGIPMADLQARMCRWPIGDPKEPDFKFCGYTAEAGVPYCGDHAKLAYQTSSRTRVLKTDDVDSGYAGTPDSDDDAKEAAA